MVVTPLQTATVLSSEQYFVPSHGGVAASLFVPVSPAPASSVAWSAQAFIAPQDVALVMHWRLAAVKLAH